MKSFNRLLHMVVFPTIIIKLGEVLYSEVCSDILETWQTAVPDCPSKYYSL